MLTCWPTGMLFADDAYGLPNFFGNLIGMADPKIARLGELVKQRRQELGIAQEDLRFHGGPSSTTLSRIELGTAESVAGFTLKRLDTALKWVEGSAATVLEGGEPTPLRKSRLENMGPHAGVAQFAGEVVAAAGAINASLRAAEVELISDHTEWGLGHVRSARAVTAQLIDVAMQLEERNRSDVDTTAQSGAPSPAYVEKTGAAKRRDKVRELKPLNPAPPFDSELLAADEGEEKGAPDEHLDE